MQPSPWERAAPLTGIISVLLILAGAFLTGVVLEYPPPLDSVLELLSRSRRVETGAYLSAAGGAFLIWFSGSVRTWLRGMEGAPGRLAAVAFGGGVAAAASLWVGFAVLASAAVRAREGINGDVALALYDVYGSVTGLSVALGLGVMVGASAVVAYRSRGLRPWAVWVSGLLAVGLLSPLSWAFVAVGLVWVAVVSVWLYLSKTPHTGGAHVAS